VEEASGEIRAAALSPNAVGDSAMVALLLKQGEAPIEPLSADGAYEAQEVYHAVAQRGARPAIPPRKGAKSWQHGNRASPPHARDENLRGIRCLGRKQWKRASGYHPRSLAENTMYRLKTLFGYTLKARLFASQATEAIIRCTTLNPMTHLGMPDAYSVP
jgi:hypothetical protein